MAKRRNGLPNVKQSRRKASAAQGRIEKAPKSGDDAALHPWMEESLQGRTGPSLNSRVDQAGLVEVASAKLVHILAGRIVALAGRLNDRSLDADHELDEDLRGVLNIEYWVSREDRVLWAEYKLMVDLYGSHSTPLEPLMNEAGKIFNKSWLKLTATLRTGEHRDDSGWERAVTLCNQAGQKHGELLCNQCEEMRRRFGVAAGILSELAEKLATMPWIVNALGWEQVLRESRLAGSKITRPK